MITESMLALCGIYIIYKIKNRKRDKCKKEVMTIVYRISDLINRQHESLNVSKVIFREFGYDVYFKVPGGISSETIKKHLISFKEGLNLECIQMQNCNQYIIFNCIAKYIYKDYTPLRIPPHVLYIGSSVNSNITVDMNTYPHLLLSGSTGSGKSRLLLSMLTNLIVNSSEAVELYLMQIRKRDLEVFQDARCIKSISKTLNQVRDDLNTIEKILIKREALIDTTKGYYSIVDYNAEHQNKLKYIYVVIDEFSFLNISRADNQYEKTLKIECLKCIKSIINAGRSSGVFLITSLQRPCADSLPSDISSNINTRLSMRLNTGPESMVILGDYQATGLSNREFICKTLGQVSGFSLTINHNIIGDVINPYLNRKTDIQLKNIQVYNIPEVDYKISKKSLNNENIDINKVMESFK